ncbi:hypothetical protein HZU40_09685 [Mycolicibacterium fluoranthenivorans]|uniref:Uncharacterized protein n=1 Tax=Mycolicibacterium fluoranthenivorans TaxID=258505 RepID=A0A7G8PJI7_9MYCO|nr:hypothetical protein [Mycolicibacterium fluoranthenivorans]QNJ91523.1 hypothetical protein HZU40_25535 [Mycolicibacterium fluoranthenivorans]QNJ94503.1 hypothetical protein HZU40_09685 [Mycolicibacterium fluoranthenivorans]
MLSDQARTARARADATGDRGDEALAAALEAAEAAECRGALQGLEGDPDTAGLPSSAEAGYLSVVKVPPGPGGN